MDPERFVVSACLAGVQCRYDGGACDNDEVRALVRAGRAIPVCPEQLAGLSTPRVRHEKFEDRIVSEQGVDETERFERGAREGLRIAQLAGCTRAVLKARSPSCGVGEIYDGSFSGRLRPGDGVFAAMLRRAGVEVTTEEGFGAGKSPASG